MIQVIFTPGSCSWRLRTTGTTWVTSPMAERRSMQIELINAGPEQFLSRFAGAPGAGLAKLAPILAHSGARRLSGSPGRAVYRFDRCLLWTLPIRRLQKTGLIRSTGDGTPVRCRREAGAVLGLSTATRGEWCSGTTAEEGWLPGSRTEVMSSLAGDVPVPGGNTSYWAICIARGFQSPNP